MKIELFKKHILALELVEEALKLAIIEQSKKIKRLTDLEFFSGSQEEIKNKLAEFLNARKLHYSKIIASLNRYIISCRYINLPSSNPQELENMIPFQIRRLFPYSAEDVTFSFDVLDTDDKGFSRIMLFVAQRERVDSFIKLLSDLKIKPEILTVSSLGILNWYLNQNKKLEDFATAVAEVSKGILEFCVVYKNKLVFTRAVLLSDNSGFSEQIKICLEAYNKELNIAKVESLSVIDNTGALTNTAQELLKHLDIKSEILKPWQNLSIKIENATTEKYRNLGWMGLVGLFEETKPLNISLLPSEAKMEMQKRTIVKSRNKTIALVFVLVLLVGLNFARYINYRSKILKKIDTKLSSATPEIDRLSDMQRKILFVKGQLAQRFLGIEIVKELYHITPEGASLSVFIYEKDNQVVLKGISEQMSLVFDYVSILEKSKFLKNAQVRFATARSVRAQEFTDFEIACSLKSK